MARTLQASYKCSVSLCPTPKTAHEKVREEQGTKIKRIPLLIQHRETVKFHYLFTPIETKGMMNECLIKLPWAYQQFLRASSPLPLEDPGHTDLGTASENQIIWNKKYRSSCSFNRKQALISLSSLALEKSLMLCMCTRSTTRLFARANDAKIVRSWDAQYNEVNSIGGTA